MPKIFGMHFFNGLFHKDKQQHDHSNVTNLIGKETLPILHHEKHPFPKLVMEDAVLKDMRVLIRVDFDVPIKQKRVANNYKIKQAIPTIEYCFKHGAKAVILMSHLGKPDGHVEKTYTLKPVAEELSLLLGKKVTFLEDCVGVKVEEACADPPEGSVILLENVRFHVEGKGKGTNAKCEDIQASEAKISEFRMALSRLGDVYVNEAFAVSHRNHSSIVGITKVQRACGLQLKKEIDTFNHVLDKPEKPVVAIFGGAKVADKIPAIEHLLDVANEIIIVGGISYTFLKDVKGVNIGKSIYDDGQKDAIKAIMKQAREKKVKIHLPEDFVIAARNEEDVEDNQCSAKYGIPENQMGLDIGFETTEHFAKIIKGAKTIVWNGPAGVCENEKFAWGTKALLAAVIGANNTGARVIIGGGDTVTAVHQLGYADEIPTLSTGGGACLHLLKGKKLPGFEALSPPDVNDAKQREDDVCKK